VTGVPSRADRLGVAGGAAAFAAAWWEAQRLDVHAREAAVMATINRQSATLYGPLAVAMQLGSLGGGIAVGGLLAARGKRVAGVATAAAATATWATVKGVKQVTGRGRPADHLDGIVIRGKAQRGLGFPSGHAAVSTATALSASLAVPLPIRAVLAFGVLATATARVYVGAHLPLDVVGGIALGVAFGSGARMLQGAFAPAR
jgi:membrane-associated phospholipid phosphatase